MSFLCLPSHKVSRNRYDTVEKVCSSAYLHQVQKMFSLQTLIQTASVDNCLIIDNRLLGIANPQKEFQLKSRVYTRALSLVSTSFKNTLS
jgi:hypothetical protein